MKTFLRNKIGVICGVFIILLLCLSCRKVEDANSGKQSTKLEEGSKDFLFTDIRENQKVEMEQPPRLLLDFDDKTKDLFAEMPVSVAYSFPVNIGFGIVNMSAKDPYKTISFKVTYSPGKEVQSGEVYVFTPYAEHVLVGNVLISGFAFESVYEEPLRFKLIKEKGYRYLCGKGKVICPDGTKLQFSGETFESCAKELQSTEQLSREAAATSLGRICKSTKEKKEGVDLLSNALRDKSWEVRRNAAESLGLIGDDRILMSIQTFVKEEKNETVNATAKEAIELIDARQAILRAQEKPLLLKDVAECLKGEFVAAKKVVLDYLIQADSNSVPHLITILSDKDTNVRKCAIYALGEIRDKRAMSYLEEMKEIEELKDIIGEALEKISSGKGKQ